MSELDQLDVKLVDQDELETSITNKANKVLLLKDAELDEKRLSKAIKRVGVNTKANCKSIGKTSTPEN